MKAVGVLSVVLVGLVAGCASAPKGSSTGLGQISKTDTICVKNFDASQAVFKGEYSDVPEKVSEDRARIPGIISTEMMKYLMAKGYTVKSYSADVTGNEVVVDGAVTVVERGSAAARMLVGMGAGKALMRANVKIYRASAPDSALAEFPAVGSSGGSGGVLAYMDWNGANAKHLGIDVAKRIVRGR